MALKHSYKVFLRFKLPDGSTREGFFRQSQLLVDIITSFGITGSAKLGKTKLDQSKSIGQLGLKNDDVVVVR